MLDFDIIEYMHCVYLQNFRIEKKEKQQQQNKEMGIY